MGGEERFGRQMRLLGCRSRVEVGMFLWRVVWSLASVSEVEDNVIVLRCKRSYRTVASPGAMYK
jgi:hypothetical protein